MSQKKPFVLRLDKTALEAVEKWAADEFCSTNGQLKWIIDKALKDAKRVKKANSTKEQQKEKPVEQQEDSQENSSEGVKDGHA